MNNLKFCKHGHLWNDANTSWFKRGDGTLFRACKLCRNTKEKLRYRNDPVWRERVKARALARYHANAR